MIRIFTLLCFLGLALGVQAQTLEELQSQKTVLEAELAEATAKTDDLKARIGGLDEEIKKLSGWRTSLSGLVGFNFNSSDKWAANGANNATSESSALNIGLTATANKLQDKSFWRNKLIWAKSWQDVDTETERASGIDDKLLADGGVADILNASSLYGYRFSPFLAASALGELNTSVQNFLAPGTADIGVGVTWTPNIDDLVVVFHPLNYRYTWLADGVGESAGGLGLKLRADYNRVFDFAGKSFAWSSTFTSYLPYEAAADDAPALNEYTWLNTLAFDLWQGIGVGVNFGIRQAEFEVDDLQSFYSVGLSYGFAR